VVKEFMEVFPEGIPELPPKKEVECSINLVPGVGPVSMGPYKMAPSELIKLKKQVEEILEKQFIRPRISPWGLQCCWLKRRTIIDDLRDQLHGASVLKN